MYVRLTLKFESNLRTDLELRLKLKLHLDGIEVCSINSRLLKMKVWRLEVELGTQALSSRRRSSVSFLPVVGRVCVGQRMCREAEKKQKQ